MKARGVDENATEDDDVLFDYDPETDGAGDLYDENEDGAEGFSESREPPKDASIDTIQLDMYASHQRVLSSDHKPVTATFTLDYDAVVPELKAKIHQEVARELDRAENEGRPDVTIVIDNQSENSPQGSQKEIGVLEGVDFGDVEYLRPIFRGLTVANTSRVPATFAFVKRPIGGGGDEKISPPWLSVAFSGMNAESEDDQSRPDSEIKLQPGDAINVLLKLQVADVDRIRALNKGSAKLEDVLILRIDNGRDHFIYVRGTWLQSCLGRSIDELIRIPEGGARALQESQGRVEHPDRGIKWSAPRELFRLTEAIESQVDRVVAERSMMTANDESKQELSDSHLGWPFEKESWTLKDENVRTKRKLHVLESLDRGRDLRHSFPPEIPPIEKLEVLAEVLLLFLGSLADGIITEALWSELDRGMSARERAKQILSPEEEREAILEALSSAPDHNISFVFLTAMLARIAGEIAPIRSGSTRDSIDSPMSLKAHSRSLSQDPATLKRYAVVKSYGKIFAHVVFKVNLPSRDKERKSAIARRRGILELFMRA
jgi:hypothetical protein